MNDEFTPDKSQNGSQSVMQENQAFHQAFDKEVQLAQSHQGKGVGSEHDEGLVGETENGGNGFNRKHHVC